MRRGRRGGRGHPHARLPPPRGRDGWSPSGALDKRARDRHTRGVIKDEVIVNDWHPVYRAAELPEGEVRKARLLGEDLVIWRTGGRVMAWLDLCIHRGSRLSMGWVEDGEIVCPYHGWRYDCEGRCTRIPAHPDITIPKKARAATYHAEERCGLVWVCMGEPANDIPPLPEWGKPGFVSVHTGPYYLRCNGLRGIENVLDITHLPFVHAGLLGEATDAEPIPDFDVTIGEDGVRTSEVRVRQLMGDHRRLPTESRYTYWCNRPLTGYLLKHVGDEDCFSHLMTFQPTEDDECNLWVITSTNIDTENAVANITDRNDEVFSQDKPILESQRPEMLPLDLREEVHNRADKFSLYYRNWLRDIGVTTHAV